MERHDLDVVSLVAGLLFVALGATFLLDELDVLDLQLRWVWPSLLIALGIAGLVTSRPRGGG